MALKAGVQVLVTMDGRAHGREWCGADPTDPMMEALTELVHNAREDGFFTADPEPKRNPLHPVGCGCGLCSGLVALVRAEGGGRCARCGCTEDDACEGGCAWTSTARVCCDVHPVSEIVATEKLFAGDKRRKAS
jgi:hypothetical protein